MSLGPVYYNWLYLILHHILVLGLNQAGLLTGVNYCHNYGPPKGFDFDIKAKSPAEQPIMVGEHVKLQKY